MSDKKGHYSQLPTSDEHEQDQPHQQQQPSVLSQAYQPPPYTPSTAPSSPYIEPNQATGASGPSSGLYPQIYSPSVPQQPYQPTYQHPKFNDTSKPPPLLAPPHQLQQQQASCTAAPLVLMKPPCRVEDLKARPGVVVCQHCHHLVLTEITPENGSCTYLGILGLLIAGITTCGCCLLPLCITSCKDMMHSCPNCHEDIGLYSRIKERTFPARHS
ncbi:LITAF-like zinc ribbon domain-containing protein [Gamsiella multidivaricata]|uniref:LITAF-like zinc ribbon domain-containing protein n=1 Tax=Gamsiella multidivaricata TaxID=101098 RepID=UPI00221F956C|nr:LITAF-like zinc ribbon domain-containing protein [Gamsiella multidivaricata]KAG0357048.1 hypothetical protein BGZ54_000488 [Gamsiella multidivaricata]KAI7823277.1 LITAF-like zinc ribbon domain-containing protein [Gamsiella multidivaricata]